MYARSGGDSEELATSRLRLATSERPQSRSKEKTPKMVDPIG